MTGGMGGGEEEGEKGRGYKFSDPLPESIGTAFHSHHLEEGRNW